MKNKSSNRSPLIYTIGHSNIEIGRFLDLLQFYSVELLVDVRSKPASRWANWFNKGPLEKALRDEGISYLFLGKELGGKPEDPLVLNPDGEPDYDLLKKTEFFKDGIDTLVRSSAGQRIAIMCSEEDPEQCHRSLLLAPSIEAAGLEVAHIRHDGNIVKHRELKPQMSLELF